MKDANELLVVAGPEGFVRTWGRLVSEASARQRGAASEPPAPPVRAARTKSPSAPGAGTPAAPRAAAKEEEQSVPPALVLDAEGTYALQLGSRTWRVRGLSAFGVDRLRVNLRVDQTGASARGTHAEASRFHVDTFDLYSARSRQAFVEAAVKTLRLEEDETAPLVLRDEIALLIEALEKERLSLRSQGKGEATQTASMTAAEREEALAFLRAPDLVEKLGADFVALGCVGEETALLTGYLAMVSRKLDEPLSVLFCARSGAGKSALQDRLCDLCPPEDLVKYTRISGQVLFYKDENALVHKLLAVDEEDGAAQAAYALRSLLSSGYLSCSVTRTDPQTGRQVADDRRVNGPAASFLTTAHPEALDYETRNRYVLVTIDESKEQTRRILELQRWNETLDGLRARERRKAVARRHHAAQRLIEPLDVVIPVELAYPSGYLILRREHRKYLSLVKAVALLHQHQRQRRTLLVEGRAVDYVEATETDVAVANGLAEAILARNLDELSPPSRSLLCALQEVVGEKRKALAASRGPDAAGQPQAASGPPGRRYGLQRPGGAPGVEEREDRLLVSRQEIQRRTGLSYWHVRTYMAQLVEYEYVEKARGPSGRTLYRLCEEAEAV